MLADKVMDINYLLVKVFRTSNPNIAGRDYTGFYTGLKLNY